MQKLNIFINLQKIIIINAIIMFDLNEIINFVLIIFLQYSQLIACISFACSGNRLSTNASPSYVLF